MPDNTNENGNGIMHPDHHSLAQDVRQLKDWKIRMEALNLPREIHQIRDELDRHQNRTDEQFEKERTINRSEFRFLRNQNWGMITAILLLLMADFFTKG